MAEAPRVGVGAFIENDAGELLLVLRRRPPEAGHWGLPGGKLDRGERLTDAVRREIAEELGIEIAVGSLLCLVEQITAEGHWIAPVWRARLQTGVPTIQELAALAACAWFSREALPAPLTIATVQALRAADES
jgi:8-oxo-dGTP diphosphatase